ncbi:MAG: hypothetical protein ACUVX8_03125 [Candidatus Zipacnadales bacterium]
MESTLPIAFPAETLLLKAILSTPWPQKLAKTPHNIGGGAALSVVSFVVLYGITWMLSGHFEVSRSANISLNKVGGGSMAILIAGG